MKKRLTVFLILVALALCLLSGCNGWAKPENPVTPPLFKIESDAGGVAYLMGTMHVGLPNTVYPEGVYNALAECQTLAVEVDLIALDEDNARMAAAMEILESANNSDNTTREMLGEDYQRVRDFFKSKRIYNAAYERYLPVVWSSALTNKLAADCGYSADYGTERFLLKYARKNSLPIHELETVEGQYMINAAQSEELQVYALVSAVDTDWETQKSQTRALYSEWSEGDIAALEQMIESESPPEALAEDYADFYFSMYENRQREMASYIISSLESGEKVFVAVGAMHLAATPDILELLEEKGYKIEDLT